MSPINKKLFQDSVRYVRKELKTMKFGKKKIMNTKVSRTLMPSIRKKGYFTKDGEIFVPIFQSRMGVRDILRHEYGHALLYQYPGIKDREGFSLFGHTTDVNDYVSHYAMTNPEEDFCETFMAYMKKKGKMPKRNDYSMRLRRKWRFITALKRGFGPSS